ncbi:MULTISPECIES: hypothetical protein [unclassified Nocardioides]|uniref:hypothetical protein n=1 Tax=unclassified Nocardioides TaxID=2615069 RepID=UPI0009EFB4F8|nr:MULTISPECIES: hypothetical protein [unclassified Nocardioides]GAW52046.1 hypothetical protein PD653B2_4396 [Nocardioides sp. PD653-B2]GAW55226.1 hypothetical protein PD653_2646 [Nocardioides sp. PD653]
MPSDLLRGAVAVTAALVLLTGCSSDDATPSADGSAAPEPSPSIRTLTPIPLPPEPPPTGRIEADMRQSSRDAAAGRMEVWVDNDTAGEIVPTRIVYRDPRYRGALPGTRLRAIPSQSERGFPLYLPDRPACDHPAGRGTVTITYGDTVRTIPVEDSTDVAGRFTRARCTELAIARVAHLSWDDEVPYDGKEGSPGTLTLVVRPTGRPGPTLTIDTVSGTPVLAPVGSDVWRPDVTVRGTDEPQRIDLPIKPNRCDDHAFLESGGATAFKVGVHLDGKPGQITLRMSIPGAADALTFARGSCGALSTVSGGG